MSMIDTVVFDLGNVLIPWDVRWLLRKVFATESEVETFIREIDFFAWHAQQDAGNLVEDGIASLSTRFPHYEAAIRAVYDRWGETMGPTILESESVLRELKSKGIRCLALSNFSAELFYRSQPAFGFWDAFDGIVLSGEERVNKPDPRIYRALFDRYQVKPEQAVFIDDSLPNVQASRALGMAAVHFTGPEILRGALREHGLPV